MNKKNKNSGGSDHRNEAVKGEKTKEKDALTAVYKVDMHCKGCASKIVRLVRVCDNVDRVKARLDSDELTIVGALDPLKMLDFLQKKTKKKFELISPQVLRNGSGNNNDNGNNGGGGGGGSGGNNKKKSGDREGDGNGGSDHRNEGGKLEKKKEKDALTAVYKVDMHCKGCASKIVRLVRVCDGVDRVKARLDSDELTIEGALDPLKFQDFLREKTKRKFELISAPVLSDGGGDNNDDGNNGGGGGGGSGGNNKKKSRDREGDGNGDKDKGSRDDGGEGRKGKKRISKGKARSDRIYVYHAGLKTDTSSDY